MEAEQLTPAERMYRQHLKNVADYQRRNPEKMKQKHQARMERIKADPVDYALFKQRRREYDRKFRENKKAAAAVEVPTTPQPTPEPTRPPTPEPECLGEVAVKPNKRCFSRK
jgi:hypothetical protein